MLLAQPLGEVAVTEHGQQAVRKAWRYMLPQPLTGLTPAAVAAAEAQLRSRTWHREAVWYSERADWLPPDYLDDTPLHHWCSAATLPLEAFHTSLKGLSVLGSAAAIVRKDVAHLTQPANMLLLGERLGAAIKTGQPVEIAECHPVWAGLRDPLLCEPPLHPRPTENHLLLESGGLPQLGDFDVVVAGGGTAGAAAAIAAARNGAKVLLLEAQHDLGGVGTIGAITCYYYGNREGFTAEVTAGLREMWGDNESFNPRVWPANHKSEWLRRELLAAGGTVWYQALVSGVTKANDRVGGVIVNTPWGRGVVRAGFVIDATGNADVAAAAGAECRVVSDYDLAIQGSGLPSRPFIPATHNTDYTFIDDSDLDDVTRAFVVARRRFSDHFEIAPLVDTRERRQIVGDVTVTTLAVYGGHTWSDAICLSRSNFDSHGFTVTPIFHALPPDRTPLDAWLPLRALQPKGLAGLLVTGLGISAERDVMPVLRMQADVQNQAYAAGLAATLALSHRSEVRRINIRELQRRLVACGILPQTTLLHSDTTTVPHAILRSAANGSLAIHAELAALLSDPEPSRLLLRQRFAIENDPELKLRAAQMLAIIGDTTAAALLIDKLNSSDWDEGWNYCGMHQFGRSASRLDDIIILLALSRVGQAKAAVLRKIGELGCDPALSHIRAVAIYCETFPDNDFAVALAAQLQQPELSNHAWTSLRAELANIPASTIDNTTRNEALRELYLARALYRCGDHEGLAAQRLSLYSHDIRGHFARHARMVLHNPPPHKQHQG